MTTLVVLGLVFLVLLAMGATYFAVMLLFMSVWGGSKAPAVVFSVIAAGLWYAAFHLAPFSITLTV